MKLELIWNVDWLNWLWRELILVKDLVRESKYTSGHKCEPVANRRQEQHCPEGIQDCENPRPQIDHSYNSNVSYTSNKNKYK